MSTKKQISLIAALVVALVISGWLSGWVSAYSPDYYHQIKKNIEVFGRVYQEIAQKYVVEVDPEKFMKAGIEGMLSTLDPYTVLVEKEDNAELQIMSSGKYGGLGMRIGLRSGWPTVVEPPFDRTPSLKAGIREGDQIIEVDGQSTKGLTVSKVANFLRGKIGSEVFLKISREGEEESIDFRLIRAEIIVTDVLYSGIIQDGIGYIRLIHFSRNAGKDIEKSIRQLKKEDLKALILDLRSNPGGLLDAAVSVSENFIDKGKLIVSTEGRTRGSTQKFYAEKSPMLEDLPLVVLVNGFSASASEIVAGAVQDLDRGLIIGTNTFGKGLVQTVIPISSEAALKITTAKYLVPSGRSIQDPKKATKKSSGLLQAENVFSESKDKKENEKSEESSKDKEYFTANGRKVYASHGITPDVIVEQETLSRFEVELLRKTMPFQFSVRYATKHPELQKGFEITEEMLAEFERFLEEKKFDYTSDAESALKKIEETAQEEEYFASISSSVEEIRSAILQHKKKGFEVSRDFVGEKLQQEISAKLWGTKAELEAGFDQDEAVQKAIEILSGPNQYHSYLAGPKKRPEK